MWQQLKLPKQRQWVFKILIVKFPHLVAIFVIPESKELRFYMLNIALVLDIEIRVVIVCIFMQILSRSGFSCHAYPSYDLCSVV